jgi:hypothetical protein
MAVGWGHSELIPGSFDCIFKGIGQCDDFAFESKDLAGLQKAFQVAFAPSAATYEGHLDLRSRSGVGR